MMHSLDIMVINNSNSKEFQGMHMATINKISMDFKQVIILGSSSSKCNILSKEWTHNSSNTILHRSNKYLLIYSIPFLPKFSNTLKGIAFSEDIILQAMRKRMSIDRYNKVYIFKML